MKKRTLVIAALVIVIVAVSLGFFWPFGRERTSLRIPGVVEVQEIRLGSKVAGRVESVSVYEGQEVEAGTELLRFEAPELRAQKAQTEAKFKQTEAAYKKIRDGFIDEKEEAQAAMLAAKAKWDRMENGWRPEEKEQAKYDLEAAEADLDYAKSEFERIKKIRAQVTPTEYDSARTRQEAAEKRAKALGWRWKMMEKGNREEDKRDAKAVYEQARAHYEWLDRTRPEDIRLAEAQMNEVKAKIAELDANLKETILVAPSKLLVEVLGVRKGDIVAPNQPVIRALSSEDRWVKVFVPETDLGKIRRGDSVEVTCDAYPGQKFKGTVIQVATISEFTPRNVQSLDERKHQVFGVKVRIDDGGQIFKPGMAAEVVLPLHDKGQ